MSAIRRDRGELWVIVDAAGRGSFASIRDAGEIRTSSAWPPGLDVPLERRTTVSTAARLRREFPGVMPWRLAHLGATTLGAVLAIVLAI